MAPSASKGATVRPQPPEVKLRRGMPALGRARQPRGAHAIARLPPPRCVTSPHTPPPPLLFSLPCPLL